jgi:hypothetical protein
VWASVGKRPIDPIRADSLTFSISQISLSRFMTSASLSLAYRRMAQRDWIGSMILLLMLQARANRVVLE